MQIEPTTNAMAERPADRVLDARPWVNSWLVLKAKSVLKEMRPGQVLEVICSDPQATEILPQNLWGVGGEIVRVSRSAEACRVFIRRSEEVRGRELGRGGLDPGDPDGQGGAGH